MEDMVDLPAGIFVLPFWSFEEVGYSISTFWFEEHGEVSRNGAYSIVNWTHSCDQRVKDVSA